MHQMREELMRVERERGREGGREGEGVERKKKRGNEG